MIIIITQERFLSFERMRKTGEMNMWFFDSGLCNDERYTKCYEHFIDNKKSTPLVFNENNEVILK